MRNLSRLIILKTFDAAILGGGTSGCVVANRLVNAGLSVCLVEAGPDYGPYSSGRWPREILDGKVSPVRTHDWGYHNTNKAGKDIDDLRAKVIGGCSAHNQCAALWPPAEDFDSWGSGWTYSELFPLIQRIEKVDSESATPFRGKSGLLETRMLGREYLTGWRKLFAESVAASGFSWLKDLSCSIPGEGWGFMHRNISREFVRLNSAFAFLDPVRESPNLTIISRTVVDKITMKGSRATEALCLTRSENDSVSTSSIEASKYILSAGVYGTPTILLRSGVGPKEDLSRNGIRENLDLPGVGKNLQDHPNIPLQFKPTDLGREMINDESKVAFASSAIVRARSSVRAEHSFDLHLIPTSGRISGDICYGTIVEDMAPKPRGVITIRGKDPNLPPLVDFRFFSDGEDAAVLSSGLLLARRIWETEPANSLVEKEILPGKSQDLLQYVESNNSTYHHPCGTCKMSSKDPEAVVDLTGLVNGTENLYVADASIIPVIPRCNINLTCFLIGLKIGEKVLENI